MSRMLESKKLTEKPELRFRENKGEIYLQVRVQRIGNGYMLKSGGAPIFFPTLLELARSLSDGLQELDKLEAICQR